MEMEEVDVTLVSLYVCTEQWETGPNALRLEKLYRRGKAMMMRSGVWFSVSFSFVYYFLFKKIQVIIITEVTSILCCNTYIIIQYVRVVFCLVPYGHRLWLVGLSCLKAGKHTKCRNR